MKFWILFFISLMTYGQDTILLNENVKKQELDHNIYLYLEQNKSLTINDLISEKGVAFEKSTAKIPNFGWGKKTAWLRFDLKANSPNSYLLHINSALFDDLSVYVVRNMKVVQKYENLSSLTPVENRPFLHRDFVFPLPNLQEKTTIYLRGKSVLNSNKFPLIIWQQKYFEQNEHKLNLFWGLIVGAFVLIAIGNFVIGLILQMRIFYFYGLYVIGIILVFLTFGGFSISILTYVSYTK